MLIVADVHGATAKLRRAAAEPGPLLILGDLINLIDYRTYDGIITEVNGRPFVEQMVRLRTAGQMDEATELWRQTVKGRETEVRERYAQLIEEAYLDICSALDGGHGYVTFGNADRPDVLRRHLPAGMRFVDGEVIEIDGWRVGFAGGGVRKIGVDGEVDDDVMAAKLDALGPVDILCTHVPPLILPLAMDVISGNTKGSGPVRDYLAAHQPRFHFFGDVHQPQAVTWRVGDTTCRNVGYFRATGRGVRHG